MDVYKPSVEGRTLYVKFTLDAQQALFLISFKEVDDRQEPAKLPRNDPKRAENRRLDLQHELLLRDPGAHRWRNEGLRLGKDVRLGLRLHLSAGRFRRFAESDSRQGAADHHGRTSGK